MRHPRVLMAATGLVAVLLAGCSGTGGSEPQSGVTPTPGGATTAAPNTSPPSADPPVRVTRSKDQKRKPPPGKLQRVGRLKLHLPKGWKVLDGPGEDSHYVATGPCKKASVRCHGFRVLGPAQIAHGNRGHAYKRGHPFYPARGTRPCPENPRLHQRLPHNPKTSGYAAVGDKQAVYYQWTIACVNKKKKVKSIFYQWEWYLPTSKILIVDQWSTASLGDILKWAK